MDERKRDSIVAYLRRRMEEVGIEIEDLAAALAEDQLRQKAARYRSANGELWNGDGEMPQWLRSALSAGQSLEHFAVNQALQSIENHRTQVNWREDPFAGSRLATVAQA